MAVVTFCYMLKPVEMTGLGKLGNPNLLLPSQAIFFSLLAMVLCVATHGRGARLATTAFGLAAILDLVLALWPTIALWRWAGQHEVRVSLSFMLAPHAAHSYPRLEKTVVYATLPDGSRLPLDMWPAPSVQEEQLHPAIVRLHGGGWVQGSRGELNDWNKWFNELGYSVYDVDYRMPPRAHWRDEVGDVKCALGRVAAHAAEYHIDPGRISLMGESAGANLALLAAYTAGDPELPPSCQVQDVRIRSVINIYGPTDMALLYRTTGSQSFLPGQIATYIGGPPSEFPERYKMLSPVTHVNADSPPTLTVHGEADRIVPVAQAVALDKALTEAGVFHETYYLPWVDHNFDYIWNNLPSQIARAEIRGFLLQHDSR